MVLQYLSAAMGEPSDMVANTLQLGIHLLNGGNIEIQTVIFCVFVVVLLVIVFVCIRYL